MMDSIVDIPAAPIANAFCSKTLIDQLEDDSMNNSDKVVRVQAELDKIRNLLLDMDEDDSPEDAHKHLYEAELILQERLVKLLHDGKDIVRKELQAQGLDDELVD